MAHHLGLMEEWDDSYQVAADIFSAIDFFDLQKVNDWHILLGILFTVSAAIFITYIKEPNIFETIYILAAIGLLNIYVFCMSKDILQYIIFSICFVIIANRNLSVKLKIRFVAIVLISESVLFRSYYILVAVLTLFFFYMLQKRKINYRIFLLICMSAFLGVSVFLKYFIPDMYMQIAAVRSSTNLFRMNSSDAQSMIVDVLFPQNNNSNVIVFLINYMINAIRMAVPLELLFKGIYYFPFCVFQICTTYFIFRAFKRCRKVSDSSTLLFLSVFLGYFFTSVLFEPDFGSWIRHEISIYPVLIFLIVPMRCLKGE